MNQIGKCFQSCLLFFASLGIILSVSQTVAQDTPPRTLIVNGKTLDAGVLLVEGRSYVDLEGLAQALGGSVTFESNQISLTLPGPSPSAAPQTLESMSKGFQQIAVFSLAEMREWRGAIGTVIT